MTLQELREALWRATGTTSATHPSTIVDIYINQSYWELQDKVDFREKESEVTISTTSGVASYALTNISDFDYLFHVTLLEETDGSWATLIPTDYNILKDNLEDNTYSHGVPEKYSRWNSSLYFFPIPDDTYSVTLLYKKALGDVGINGPDIPEAWHEYVLLGALYRFFRDLGEYNRAVAIRNERDVLVLTATVNKAKEREDYRNAGVRILRQRYP